METLIIVFLFIIIIILIWDTSILRRIYQLGKKSEHFLADNQYYELKYSINLLKALATVLIFVFGLIGYTTFKDIKSELENEVSLQKHEIELISKRLSGYKDSLDSLDNYKNEISQGISKFDNNFSKLNSKVDILNNTLKFSPKIFVVKEQKFPFNIENAPDTVKIEFKDLFTASGERLPKFKHSPIVLVQGRSLGLHILSVNNDYFLLQPGVFYGDANKASSYLYDIWIAVYE